MMKDEGETANRPEATDNSWIVIDDTQEPADEPSVAWGGAGFDTPPGAASSGESPVTPEEPSVTPRNPSSGPPPNGSQGNGWDSFAGTETWNGMPVAPPGTTLGSAPPADVGGSVGRQVAGTTGPSPSASGWGVHASEAGQGRSERTVESTWFIGDGEDDDAGDGGGTGGTARSAWVDRLPRVGGPVLSPALITFTVICLSALLTISSIIWHPRAP
ncbi:hypothetical protein [Actinoallomurus sp. NPDC050550]|uniref:hypothetical protein n=1 Tax=Actinoallomurus sp. NPDC050550 TaxID=3154937 RepID=UPI0033D32E29